MFDQVRNDKAEVALLGDMMIDPRIVSEVARTVPVEAYFLESHRKIAAAIYDLRRRNLEIDLISILTSLNTAGHLESVGGQKFLIEVTSKTPAAANWETHAALVNAA